MELDLNNKTFGYWDVIEKDVELSKAKNIFVLQTVLEFTI